MHYDAELVEEYGRVFVKVFWQGIDPKSKINFLTLPANGRFENRGQAQLAFETFLTNEAAKEGGVSHTYSCSWCGASQSIENMLKIAKRI